MSDETMLVVANPKKGTKPYDNRVIFYDVPTGVCVTRKTAVQEVPDTEAVRILLMRGVVRKATAEEAKAFKSLSTAQEKAETAEASSQDAKIAELEAKLAAMEAKVLQQAQADPQVLTPADEETSTGDRTVEGATQETTDAAKASGKGKGK